MSGSYLEPEYFEDDSFHVDEDVEDGIDEQEEAELEDHESQEHAIQLVEHEVFFRSVGRQPVQVAEDDHEDEHAQAAEAVDAPVHEDAACEESHLDELGLRVLDQVHPLHLFDVQEHLLDHEPDAQQQQDEPQQHDRHVRRLLFPESHQPSEHST